MIEHYSFGNITIDGRDYHSDLILCGGRIIDNWWRKEGHELHVGDIFHVIEKYMPEVLVLGTGSAGALRVMSETERYLKSEGIELIAEKTGDAWKTFNRMAITGNVMGAFHLTC